MTPEITQHKGCFHCPPTLPRLFLHQQEEHVLHIVLDGAGLIGRDGTQAQGSTAAAAGVTGEETESPDAAATRLVLL